MYSLSVVKDGECVRYTSGDIAQMVTAKFLTVRPDSSEYDAGIRILHSIHTLIWCGSLYSNHDFDVLSEAYDYAN